MRPLGPFSVNQGSFYSSGQEGRIELMGPTYLNVLHDVDGLQGIVGLAICFLELLKNDVDLVAWEMASAVG